MSDIKVVIFGVGSCVKNLYEGISFFYKKSKRDNWIDLSQSWRIYSSDILFIAVFDFEKRKFGRPFQEVIAIG